ncbi:MAG: M28 family peptidase [Gemmatimonadaceae bacterium]
MWPGVARGQGHEADGGTRRGALAITESDLRRHVFVIADDSMGGRDTPSPGLELTARYIAEEFRKAGVRPAGDSSGYLQRYPIATKVTDVASTVRFQVGDTRLDVTLGRDARWTMGPRTGRPIAATTVLLAGPLGPDVTRSISVKGRTILWAIDYTQPLGAQLTALDSLVAQHPAALVLLSNRDSASFAARVELQLKPSVVVGIPPVTGPVVVEVHERAVGAVLAAVGTSVEELRHANAPVVRDLPELMIVTTVRESVQHQVTAPNVVGILEGSDPVLRNEFVVCSAHMDHVGIRKNVAGDSIWNGADDDASGTAAIVELAKALAVAPPRRSVLFVTVSGEEKGLWGSDHFTAHPPVPIDRMVADINLDMIGRNWKDTIVVIGKEHSTLGARLERVNAQHPELGLQAIDDIWPQESFYFRSDHFNFARRGVPILFFFNGTHADYHEPSDSPDKIDYEKEARIVRLVYYLVQDVASDAERPRWNPESYKKIVIPR